MKDFDTLAAERESRDRTFKLRGREFKFKAATRPEDVAELFDWLDGFSPLMPQLEQLAVLDRAMVGALLEPDSQSLWTEVRSSSEQPVTQQEILEVLAFVLEVQTGRPILQLAASTGSASGNGTTSTVSSASPAAVASSPSASASS